MARQFAGLQRSLPVVVCRRWPPSDGPQTARRWARSPLVACHLSLVLSLVGSQVRAWFMVFRAPSPPCRDKRQDKRQGAGATRRLRVMEGEKGRPTAAGLLAARCARAATTVAAKAVGALKTPDPPCPRLAPGGPNDRPRPHRGATRRQFPPPYARVRVGALPRKLRQLGNRLVRAGCRGQPALLLQPKTSTAANRAGRPPVFGQALRGRSPRASSAAPPLPW